MRSGQLTAGTAKLLEAADNLKLAWVAASDQWNDSTSRNFYDEHLLPVLREVSELQDITGVMNELLIRMKRDCDPS